MAASKDIFFNRELSWIEFNARVLSQACKKELPLLERLTFLSIVTSNFNEFFQVRVASIKRLMQTNPREKDSSGLTPKQVLRQISLRAHEITAEQQRCLKDEILPQLAKAGYVYRRPYEFTASQQDFTLNLFREQILPLLTPLRAEIDSFPQIGNLQTHAAFMLSPIHGIHAMGKQFEAKKGVPLVAIVPIPRSGQHIIWLPSEKNNVKEFTLEEDLVLQYGTHLFSGFEVVQSMLFNVARDADFAVDEEAGNDFIHAMEEVLVQRQSSFAVRIVCNKTSRDLQRFFMSSLELQESDIYEVDEMINLETLQELDSTEEAPALRFEPWKNFFPATLPQDEPFWDTLKQHDVMVHVPYESYQPVVKFLSDAADDPAVLSIKMTLYRTGRDSPIISALEKAAANGKQVTVLVELKARFDEERNIAWAAELEKAGVIVVYGLQDLKVHAKIAMIIRREENSIKRYVHFSTGNYNPRTAKIYSDISIFTTNEEIANDAIKFFNVITGYSALQTMKTISMAPVNIKSNIISMIQREIELSTPDRPGLIIAKMNSLTHEEVISQLYKASRAGVRIMLNVRGICMLVPGVKGMSENIKVYSIVGRYLEHERIFYFQNGGAAEIYISSADWMSRNLDRRIELMFPILDPVIFKEIKSALDTYFNSNTNIYSLDSNGVWTELKRKPREGRLCAQEILYAEYKKRAELVSKDTSTQFKVRRKN